MKIIGLFINTINSLKNLNWNLQNNKFFFKFFFNCIKDYSIAVLNINKNYSNQILDSKKLSQFKKSDTVVIFGSGSSLNKIEDDIWSKIKEFGMRLINHRNGLFNNCTNHSNRGHVLWQDIILYIPNCVLTRHVVLAIPKITRPFIMYPLRKGKSEFIRTV